MEVMHTDLKTQLSDQGVEQADETEQANKEEVTSPDGALEQGEPVQGDDQQTSLEETNPSVTQEGEGNVNEPVSYTHLTLPTIYSV